MKTRTRILVAGTAGLASLAIATPAFAHTFSAADECGGLSWAARDFESDPAQPNTIVVTVDGSTVYSDLNFGANDIGSRPWTPTADHTWSIVVNAPGTDHDYNVGGTQVACQPTTTTAVTTTTITEETTTSTTQPATTTSTPASSTSVTVSTDPSTTSSTTLPPSSSTSPTTSSPPRLPPTGPSDSTPGLIALAVAMIIAGWVLNRTRKA